jgi:hypothetical protein
MYIIKPVSFFFSLFKRYTSTLEVVGWKEPSFNKRRSEKDARVYYIVMCNGGNNISDSVKSILSISPQRIWN